MSSPETTPQAAVHDIADYDGVSIIETAQAQVAAKKELGDQKHTAVLEEAALRTAAQTKLNQRPLLRTAAQTKLNQRPLHPPVEAVGPEVVDYHRQRQAIDQDANLLLVSSNAANGRAWDAHIEMEKNDRASTAHVDENLPAYVETATNLANSDLAPRIGDKAVVTSRADGLVGFTEVASVNPATENQDVAPPPEAAGPAAH